MKFCTHCGADLADEAIICPKCGCSVGNGTVQSKGHNTLGLVGFILSLVGASVVALVLSSVGYVQGKKKGEKVSLALAGIIISSISCVALFIYYIIYFASFLAYFSAYAAAFNQLAVMALPLL